MSFDKNIATDYLCPTNGSATATPFFCDWRADAQADLALHPGEAINLTIPPGTYIFDDTSDTGRDTGVGFHLSDLLNTTVTVTATGATLTGQYLVFGNRATSPAMELGESNKSSDIATVAAGSTTVQLLTPAEYTRFSANSYAYICGLDLQGDGQPSNHHFFEYVYITAIDSDGLVTLSTPLRDGYRADWPNYEQHTTTGGPARLYVIDVGWDQSLEIIGATITNTVATPNSRARHIKFTNCTITDNCPNPSSIKTYEVSGGDWSSGNQLEVDKLVDEIILDGVATNDWRFQSSSIRTMTLRNGASMVACIGTPQYLNVYDSEITTLAIGAYAYGASSRITAYNSDFTSISQLSTEDKAAGANGIDDDPDYSMSNGVIRVLATRTGNLSQSPLRWAVPGTTCLWQGSDLRIIGSFRVVSVTLTGGYIYVTTSESGGFPDVTDWGGDLWIKTHPCPQMRFTNCTGDGAFFSLPGYYNRPLYSYFKHTFTEADIGNFASPGGTGDLWGLISQIRVNVINAYAGAENPCLYGFASFTASYPLKEADFNSFSWFPRVDLRTAGLRVINSDGTVTGSTGADTGIDFSDNDPGWLTQGFNGGVTGSFDISDDGDAVSVEVEIFSEQGVSPLRRSIEIHGGTYRGY